MYGFWTFKNYLPCKIETCTSSGMAGIKEEIKKASIVLVLMQ
jgi:hypothetical protein